MPWMFAAAALSAAAAAKQNSKNRKAAESANAASAESTGPWKPAQPYMLENLQKTKQLQDYYQQNPFNQQQKTSYQNIFGDLDNFRQNTAPSMMGFANNMMGSSYQRQRGGEPGSGGGYGGPVQQGGLLQGGQGPFSAPQGRSYGMMDFNAQNHYRNGAITPTPVAAAPQVDPAYAAWLRQQELLNYATYGGDGGDGGASSAGDSDAGGGASSAGDSDAGAGPSGGASGAGDSSDGASGADGGGGDGGGGGGDGWANGGEVTRGLLRGHNPAGPDDGYGALDHGEFVIRTDAVNKYGKNVMHAINSGDISASRLAALARKASK